MLAYIWVNNYKNIKECGYSLHNSFAINTLNENQRYSIEIKHKDTIVSRDNFFGSVNNVTSLIGENGTGKSNFFDFIKLIFSRSRIQTKFILIFEENKNFDIFAYNFQDNDEIIVDCGYYNFTFEKLSFNYKTAGLNKNINTTPVIYYSDVYDYRFENEKFLLTNISTNYLMNNENYRYSEIKKQLKLLSADEVINDYSLKLQKPNFIRFGISTFTAKRAFQRTKEILDSDKKVVVNNDNKKIGRRKYQSIIVDNALKKRDTNLEECINNIFDKLIGGEYYHCLAINIINESDTARKAIVALIFHLMHNIIICSSVRNLDSFFSYFAHINDYNGLREFLDAADLDFSVIGEFKFADIRVYTDNYISLIAGTQPTQENQIIFIETPFDHGSEKLQKLFELDEIIKLKKTPFFIDMLDFSSGEKAQLNLYSRLYSLKSKFEDHDSLILIIDEAGLYYHPKWQIEFFDDLLKFLSMHFKNKKIQLIIATHSPFLLSDISNDCALFLTRSSNGRISVENNVGIKTFAMRITDIFEEGFSINSGLIGQFAKNKLSTSISEIINSTSLSQLEKKETLILYNNILGDKLLSTQLEKVIERLETQRD